MYVTCGSAFDTAQMPSVIRFAPDAAEAITHYGATSAFSVRLGSGSGESHAYVLHFDQGGEIGVHEAGFDARERQQDRSTVVMIQMGGLATD